VTQYCFQGNNASAVPVAPSSLLGIGGYVPSAHIAGIHSYMMNSQGIPQPLTSSNSGVPQFGNFQAQSAVQPNVHWPNQLVSLFSRHLAYRSYYNHSVPILIWLFVLI
jgi:hypothetical protein